MSDKLELISKSVLQKARIGVWFLEYTDKEHAKLVADEYMCKELGLPENASPEETYKLWRDGIVAEDVDRVNEALKKLVHEGKGDDFDFGWKHPTRGIVYICIGGYRNNQYKDEVRLEGFFQEITELATLRKQNEIAEQRRKEELEVYDVCSKILRGDFDYIESCVRLLKAGCDFYGCDRAQLFVYSKDKAFFTCLLEWMKDGYKPIKDNLKVMPARVIQSKVSLLSNEGILYLPDSSVLEQDSKELAEAFKLCNSASLIGVPVLFDTGLDGFIIMDNPVKNIGNWEIAKNVCTFVYGELLYGEVERAEAQKQLVKFDEIFIHMPFIAYLKNSETGKYITVSTEFLQAANLEDSSQAVGKTDYDIFNEKTARKIIQDDKYALSLDRPYVFNETRTDSEGNTRYYQTTKVRFIDSTGRLDILSMSVDVTDSYLLNEERQSTVEEEKNKSVAANNAKSKFLLNMSHDIRTPMDVINGFTERALRHSNDPKTMLECLDKIKECSKYMTYIINGIIDLTSIEEGKMELNEEIASIPEVAKDVVGMLQGSAAEKDISIRYDFKNIKEKYSYFDALKFRQILTNIVSNSVKFTNPGGQIWIRGKQAVSTKTGYCKFIVSVEDNGIGMAPEFVKKIFDQFEKERNSTESGIEGTGLGMSIVKSLVDFMKGKIDITSKVNEGTTVELTFMFKRVEAKDVEFNIKRQQELEAALDLAKSKRILLVDDNDLNREISLDLLEEMGLTVETAVNGAVAVNMISRKGPDYYDMVLMDIQMPVMDGYEATREIRSFYPESSLPIVALSANAFERDIKMSLDSGMNDHIAKPIEQDKLKQILLKYCK